MWTWKPIKTILIIMGIVSAIFFVPLIIQRAYNANRPKIFTDWGATEVLLYWGSALGGLSALGVMIIVMRHDDKKREDDIKRNDKQREDDRDFYQKERENERQHYKEQREEDRKMSLKKERYGIISKHLYDSLCNLDMRAFFVINEDADAYYSNRVKRIVMKYNQRAEKVRDIIAPDTIPNLIENANRNVLLGLVLFSDERPYFNHVIEDLKELTKNYTSLLPILDEHKDDELRFPMNKEAEHRFPTDNGDEPRLPMDEAIPYWLDKFLKKNKDLCCKYKEMSTSIEKAMTDYEQSYNPRPLQMGDSQAAPLSTSSDAVGGDGCVDS